MDDHVKAFVVVSAIVIALFFGFCCHFASQKRRDEEQNTRAFQTSGNANRNNVSTAYVMGLQDQGATSNSNARAPNENQPPDGGLLSPDPIADCGPPPYRCLIPSGEPLSPPPSYEAALRASTEQLAVTRQHVV